MKLELAMEFTAPSEGSLGKSPYPPMQRLEALLARGDPLAVDAGGLDQWLAGAFGFDAASPLPYAAFSALADGLDPSDAQWLRIDPVCLRATRTHLTLSELRQDPLTMAEAQELAAVVSAHLAVYGFAVSVPDPQRWYLRASGKAAMRARPPWECRGTLDESHLPFGPDAALWKRIVTEVQMLLHSHPVNERREAEGRPPANAVWPWGGGSLPRGGIPLAYDKVFSADPAVRGIARAVGAHAQSMPEHGSQIIEAIPDGSKALAVVRVQAMEIQADTLERFQIEPLYEALASARIDVLSLRLFLPRASVARRVTRANLRRWWRRSHSVGAYA